MLLFRWTLCSSMRKGAGVGPLVWQSAHCCTVFAAMAGWFLIFFVSASRAGSFPAAPWQVGHLTGDNFGDADTGEDRMEAAAKKMGKHSQAIAEEITELYFKDLDALERGCDSFFDVFLTRPHV